jgi:four helix bundle protein
MNYDEWEATVPKAVRDDAIWHVQAFRLASYLSAVAELDSETIAADQRLARAAAQLVDATGSIPANVVEGYARLSPKDRIRYYEYALGSANEAKSRYLSLARLFTPPLLDDRIATLNSITRLILKMIRSGRLRSQPPPAE